MVQEMYHTLRESVIKKCITPDEAIVPYEKNTPSDQLFPSADRKEFVFFIGAVKVSPLQITRITVNKKLIERTDSFEKLVPISCEGRDFLYPEFWK
jgi:hypothetical protein